MSALLNVIQALAALAVIPTLLWWACEMARVES